MDNSDCIANDIATSKVDTISSGRCVNKAVSWLEQNGYDVAPVTDENNEIIGYVKLSELKSDNNMNDSVENHIEKITITEILSSDARFSEVMDALYNNTFYFIGGKNNLNGILTRADLNTPSARNYLFSQILVLEKNFENLIQENVEWQDEVRNNKLSDIEERYDRARKANIELPMITYAQFSTKVNIISNNNYCLSQCGYKNKTTETLYEIVDLRNDVAHGHPIIQNTESTSSSDNGREITELSILYNEISRLNQEL